MMDGKEYASGTVWEYENAAGSRKPVWIYRRTEIPTAPLGNEESLLKANRQYIALQDFLKSLRNAQGSPVGINDYASSKQFAEHFSRALEGWTRMQTDAAAMASEEDMRRASSTLQSTGNEEVLAAIQRMEAEIKQLEKSLKKEVDQPPAE